MKFLLIASVLCSGSVVIASSNDLNQFSGRYQFQSGSQVCPKSIELKATGKDLVVEENADDVVFFDFENISGTTFSTLRYFNYEDTQSGNAKVSSLGSKITESFRSKDLVGTRTLQVKKAFNRSSKTLQYQYKLRSKIDVDVSTGVSGRNEAGIYFDFSSVKYIDVNCSFVSK